MENIFTTIINKLPKATEEQKAELNNIDKVQDSSKHYDMSLKDLVSAWQKKPDMEYTTEVLKRLKPTISSAITSYAPGMEKELSIKAAKVALNALKSYDSSFGADPTTFVFHNLKRLNRLSSKRSNIIPVSERAALDKKFVLDVQNKLTEDLGREPSLDELANKTGFSTKKIDSIINGSSIVNDSSTLTEENRNATVSFNDLTDDDYFDYVYKSVGPIDQKIMEWSSGLHKKPLLSNNQIAEKLKMSAAAVSQRKNKIQQLMSDARGLV